MANVIKKIQEDKKEYRRQMARVAALPEDYRFVYEKMQNYMWSFASGSGMDMLKTQYELIDLFETSALEGKHVLSVTGKDVAVFCDELVRGNRLWVDSKRKKLNKDMQTQFDNGNDF
ncbi:MAG: DUF1048 domain-containing protein [Lachnospiraceae bacterium]